jgi:uncharacterized membrane protein
MTNELKMILDAVVSVSGDARNVVYMYFGYRTLEAMLIVAMLLYIAARAFKTINAYRESDRARERLAVLLEIHPHSDFDNIISRVKNLKK